MRRNNRAIHRENEARCSSSLVGRADQRLRLDLNNRDLGQVANPACGPAFFRGDQLEGAIASQSLSIHFIRYGDIARPLQRMTGVVSRVYFCAGAYIDIPHHRRDSVKSIRTCLRRYSTKKSRLLLIPRGSSVDRSILVFPASSRMSIGARQGGPTNLGRDRGMPSPSTYRLFYPRKLVVVRREAASGPVASAWGAALGKVCEFIRSQSRLRTDSHNIFLYTTRRSRARRSGATSASSSREHLKLRARYTRPKRKRRRLPSLSTGPHNRVN